VIRRASSRVKAIYVIAVTATLLMKMSLQGVAPGPCGEGSLHWQARAFVYLRSVNLRAREVRAAARREATAGARGDRRQLWGRIR
jgi:hypothetical protein